MDLTRLLGRVAAAAPTPVFPVAGRGGRRAVQDLRLSPDLEVVPSPRAAAILLVAGEVDESDTEALARVHDLMPHPRATVHWRTSSPRLEGVRVETVAPDVDVVPAVRSIARELLSGSRPSDPPVLPDVDPVEWRGVGPYGQGGSGMTGGTPYGRPMAELGPDRDGLRLDVLPVTLGPFLPWLPPRIVLELRLAGDLVTDATVVAARTDPSPAASRQARSPFVRALVEPVPIAEVEVARAEAHLRWLSDALLVQGLPALSRRALRLARDVTAGDGGRVRGFAALLRGTGVVRWSLGRAGAIGREQLAGRGLGPVARAAGLPEDERLDNPAYASLGFEPVVLDQDDPAGRWLVRLEEAARSLDLAAAAGEARTVPNGRVESPRGRLQADDAPTGRALRLLPEILPGLEWGDAVAALVSLDLDVDESGTVATGALAATA